MEPSAKINRNATYLWSCFSRLRPRTMVLSVVVLANLSGLAILTQQSESGESSAIARQDKKFLVLGRFEDRRISESSGVVTARPTEDGKPSNSIWTFNDSGGQPMLFRVNIEGQTEATLELGGATNRDWEAMCRFSMGDKHMLAVGDVGDNGFIRDSYQLYVISEPAIVPELSEDGKLEQQRLSGDAVRIDFTYEDRSHNCEAVCYNVDDGSFWLFEKVNVDEDREEGPGIYALPNPLLTSKEDKTPKNIAKRVAGFPVRNVTGATFSPDNKRLAIRNYFGAWLYERPADMTWLEAIKQVKPSTLALPLQSQGEAICFSDDSQSLIVTSEFVGAIIWRVRLDQKADRQTGEDKK